MHGRNKMDDGDDSDAVLSYSGRSRAMDVDVSEKRLYGVGQAYRADVSRSRFPFCIVWTPLPMITWLLPFIGHMGIADSRGVIYDFAGPYTISVDDFSFGRPTRVLSLDPSSATLHCATGEVLSSAAAWDAGVDAASRVYCKRMHNICCDNCHSHVARALNEMAFAGRTDWNMVTLAAWMFFAGKYVSFPRAVATWLPFLIIVSVIVLLKVFL